MTMVEYYINHPDEMIAFKCVSKPQCIATAAAIEAMRFTGDYTGFNFSIAGNVVAQADLCRCCTSDRYAVVATGDTISPYLVVTTGKYFAEANRAFHETGVV